MRDIRVQGISPLALSELVESGKLERVGRGLYLPRSAKLSVHHTLVEAAVRTPHALVCLLSALRLHGLGTQNPHEVWIAIDVKAWKPVSAWPPLRVVRFSGAALSYGVEVHRLEGVDVRVTSPEKTVADCFKYRNKIGLDVAMEALQAYLRSPKRSIENLNEAATVCRVARVMRPYLEAMV